MSNDSRELFVTIKIIEMLSGNEIKQKTRKESQTRTQTVIQIVTYLNKHAQTSAKNQCECHRILNYRWNCQTCDNAIVHSTEPNW